MLCFRLRPNHFPESVTSVSQLRNSFQTFVTQNRSLNRNSELSVLTHGPVRERNVWNMKSFQHLLSEPGEFSFLMFFITSVVLCDSLVPSTEAAVSQQQPQRVIDLIPVVTTEGNMPLTDNSDS